MPHDAQAIKQPAGGVQSVERVFALLELVAASGGEISLSDLAEKSQLPLPTIHRLLRTLVTLGYIRQQPSRRYALGARLIPLGEWASRQLGSVVMPELRSLVDELGETANMARLEGEMVVYVAQQPSPHAMRMFTEVGRTVNLHDTGVGKAILATLDDQVIKNILTRTGMPTPTSKSHGSIESMMSDVTQIRHRGYAIDDEEQELGVRCYAVPIPRAPTPMAVSVSGPVSRVDLDFGERAVPLLRATAERIGKDLDGQFDAVSH